MARVGVPARHQRQHCQHFQSATCHRCTDNYLQNILEISKRSDTTIDKQRFCKSYFQLTLGQQIPNKSFPRTYTSQLLSILSTYPPLNYLPTTPLCDAPYTTLSSYRDPTLRPRRNCQHWILKRPSFSLSLLKTRTRFGMDWHPLGNLIRTAQTACNKEFFL